MKTFTPDVKINLHGFKPDAALLHLSHTLESGRYHNCSVLVIHGYGQGILREKIRSWAKKSSLIKKIWNGEEYFLPGGGGVTLLFL